MRAYWVFSKTSAYPRGNCLNSVFFLLPAVQTNPSSLHLLQGDSPSHLVFFILHLSHAFHTLLCLPSNTTAVCSCDGVDLFEVRFNDLLGFESCFFEIWDLWSSIGGVGRPDMFEDRIRKYGGISEAEVSGLQENIY
jgi:hypothetical protein